MHEKSLDSLAAFEINGLVLDSRLGVLAESSSSWFGGEATSLPEIYGGWRAGG